MRIIFDVRNVGLGNNGGSLTLIRSANILQEMGHKIYFTDTGKNRHTWTKLEVDHVICKKDSLLPDADFIIATGFKSVSKTVSAPERCGIKAHWIRGWETWQFSPKKIVTYILEAPTIKIVNSLGLKNMLKHFNFKSEIIRPGYDLDEIYPVGKDKKNINFVLGGLYTKGKHESIKRTIWVIETYKYLSKKYGNIDLWMFGNDLVSNRIINFFHQPTPKVKQYFYNNIDLWLSPSIQEGLHMPPAEAMMAEKPVVGVKADLSGTHDYLIDEMTGFVSKNELPSFIENVERLYLDTDLRKELGKRARKKIEELGSRKDNMKKLIKFLTGYKK